MTSGRLRLFNSVVSAAFHKGLALFDNVSGASQRATRKPRKIGKMRLVTHVAPRDSLGCIAFFCNRNSRVPLVVALDAKSSDKLLLLKSLDMAKQGGNNGETGNQRHAEFKEGEETWLCIASPVGIF